ncbi:F-box/LRR-repeat protein [Striga hermonthica]|uniref:F-box/LRR-repeat protein n=1 Tax=Striga hermonthica TaxID=68872 RepID=A0A9N7NRE9_STRHE|nr:F-box/LRR-repeat protein [Striga hermonthica]
MKKLKHAAETEETLSTAMADDRISNLPIHTLHRILCSLSQKEAVRTCLLSKHWRYIGSTRPNLEFSEYWFDNTQQNFVSVVSRTLQGYLDQNLSIHKLHLHLSRPMVSLLDKWIQIIAALGIKAFKLDIFSSTSMYYDLPSAVFLSDSLQELHLCQCRLSQVESLRFKSLHTLTLRSVQVDGGTFETKTLRCPLLRRLVIKRCWELRNVWLSEAPGLKHFVLSDYKRIEGGSIIIDVPNLETIFIRGPWIWSPHRSTFLFSRLTSLHLCNVILSSESIDMLSFGFPTLESLALDNCSGFEELHLAKSWYSDFTNDLFRVCRPRLVWGRRFVCELEVAWNQRLSNFQFNVLLASMSLGTFWRHDLEQVHVKTVVGKIWQLVEWMDLSELRKRTYNRNICLQLKWRGQNCETGRMDGPYRFSFTPVEGVGLFGLL